MTPQFSLTLSPLERAQAESPPPPKDFPGETFDWERDGARLAAQEGRVYDLMKDGAWRGLREIAALTGDPEASVSARLRGLRKKEGCTVDRKYVSRGLWHYRIGNETDKFKAAE